MAELWPFFSPMKCDGPFALFKPCLYPKLETLRFFAPPITLFLLLSFNLGSLTLFFNLSSLSSNQGTSNRWHFGWTFPEGWGYEDHAGSETDTCRSENPVREHSFKSESRVCIFVSLLVCLRWRMHRSSHGLLSLLEFLSEIVIVVTELLMHFCFPASVLRFGYNDSFLAFLIALQWNAKVIFEDHVFDVDIEFPKVS